MQWIHRRSTKCGHGRRRRRRTNSARINHPPPFRRVTNKSAYGRIFYNILLHKFKYNTNFLVKWEQELDIIENIENNNLMMKYITNAFQYTNDTTLRWFQYRISHRILATNEYLFKIKIKDLKLCTF